MTITRHIQTITKSTCLGVAFVFTVALSLPLITTATAAAECIAPDSSANVSQPTGADAAVYNYNCDTGLWESARFTFDPTTGSYAPKDTPVYIYNSDTNAYDFITYVWSTPLGDYVASPQSVTLPPVGAVVQGAPTAAATAISDTGANSTNTINNNGGAANGSNVSNTGAGSNNTVNGTANTTTNTNSVTNATMNNTITATAESGNALVLENTIAGNAQTGNAQDIANVVNLLQSSSNALGGNTVTFVANIDGDVNGDLFFDPAQVGSVQPASATGNNNLTLNNQTNANINNSINLTANSGDATVSRNTKAGDATTGSATTIANVVNLINSAVSSGKSFMGTININGNLNGDILVPDNFVNQLIEANTPTVTISNTGAGSNNSVNTTGSNNTQVTNTNNVGITNNVAANAASGAATVSQNTKAGSAKTGDATTNITAFNLTGSQVIGKNAMLVFVNVLGSWVGLIVNAPAGATAAALGGNTRQTKTGNNNTTVNNLGNYQITNNITTNATSGDATVSQNTEAGNATSGDARGAINLANVQNTSLVLSDWFGILFINVFGTWRGSFGVNTSAGDPIASGSASPTGTQAGASSFGAAPLTGSFASFIPKNGTKTASASNGPAAAAGGAVVTNPASNAVLAAATVKDSQAPTPALTGTPSNFALKAAVIIAIVALIIIADAWYSRRKRTV